MKKLTLILILLGTSMLAVQAQNVIFDVQVRPRAEFRNGFKTLSPDPVNPAFFVEQRTRFNGMYSSDKFKLRFSFQDVRMWGGTTQIYKSDPALTNIFEGWGRYYFNEAFSFKIGRQAIAYHNERFMGALGWAQQGRSHDALLLMYDKDGLRFDAGIAFNQMGTELQKIESTYYPSTGNYKAMQYLYFGKTTENTTITAIFNNDGRQTITDALTPQADTIVAYRQTLGVTLDQNIGDLKVGGEFYYQGGKDERAIDVTAIFFSAYATLNTNLTPLTLGVDYASGSDDHATKNKAWNPLYGTNHKFYGWMDYFYVGNGHMNTGLVDVHLFSKFKTGEKSSFQARAHYFMSPVSIENIANDGNSYSNGLGFELDLVMTWKLHPSVDINLGYSQLFATTSMEVLKPSGSALTINNWAWLQVNFAPQLINWEINKTE